MRKAKANYESLFQIALRLVLDVASYAYYVKADNIIDDLAFDSLERLWKKYSGQDEYPMRGKEDGEDYPKSIVIIYHQIERITELKKLERIEKVGE